MPDGQRILSGSNDHRPCVAPRRHPQEHFSSCTPKASRGAARQPARALRLGDDTVKLFNVNDGAVLRTFTHHTNGVRSLTLLPDGLRFVSGSDDEPAVIVEHGLAPQGKSTRQLATRARPAADWRPCLDSIY